MICLCFACFAYVLRMFCVCFAYVLHMCCVCFAYVLRMFCACFAYVLRMFCACFAYVLRMFCAYFAYVLRMFCVCFANVLHRVEAVEAGCGNVDFRPDHGWNGRKWSIDGNGGLHDWVGRRQTMAQYTTAGSRQWRESHS